MHKITLAQFLVFSFLLVFFTVNKAHAEMDPRAKALGSMALYGTIGGTLLGIAAQAFDVEDSFGRSMAKGASLGLYTGLLFGSYVVISHYYRSKVLTDPPPDDGGDNYYPEEGGSPYEVDGGQANQRWNANWEMEDLRINDFKLKSIQQGALRVSPIFYLNLLNFQF